MPIRLRFAWRALHRHDLGDLVFCASAPHPVMNHRLPPSLHADSSRHVQPHVACTLAGAIPPPSRTPRFSPPPALPAAPPSAIYAPYDDHPTPPLYFARATHRVPNECLEQSTSLLNPQTLIPSGGNGERLATSLWDADVAGSVQGQCG